MQVLVTGGCGYIGSKLIPMLLEEEHEITILDNFSLSSPSVLFDLKKEVNVIFGDIRNQEDANSAVKNCEAVIHLAALTGADESFKFRKQMEDINIQGTKTLLEASFRAEVDQFTFASSCNIYGRQKGNITEDNIPNPLNPYAWSKFSGEKLCKDFQYEGLNTSILRLSTLYGYAPGMRFNLVINMFALYALTHHPLTIYGDGSNWRPYIHASDAARVFSLALEDGRFRNQIFNVGANSENYRIEDIARFFREYINEGLEIQYLKEKDPGPSYKVDFSRLEGEGFRNEYRVKDGIRELIDRFKKIRVK